MSKGLNKTNNAKKKKGKPSAELDFDEKEKDLNMDETAKESLVVKSVSNDRKINSSTKKGKLPPTESPQVVPPIDRQDEVQQAGIDNSEKTFDISQPLYMQLHAGNIYQIFSSAILSLNPGPFNDVQRQSGAGLLLSNGYFEKLDETTILLELKLGKSELASLAVFGSNAYYQRPLPVTRVYKIFVANDRIKKEILVNALSSDGGIIPERLLVPSFPDSLNRNTLTTDQIYLSEFTDQLDRFNRIVGTFSFLRNYGVLLSNRTQSIETFPDHFFAAIHAINQHVPVANINEKQVQFYRQLFNINSSIDHPVMAWLINRVNNNRNFTDEDTRNFGVLLFANSSSIKFSEESKRVLEQLSKSIDRRSVLPDIAQMDEADKFYTYLFAALRLYGNLNTESRSISRIDLREIISPSYGGFVFALLGYFFGYDKLRNYEERVDIKDPILADIINAPRRWALKFELDTFLDYVIIESVYELVFNDNKDISTIDHSLFPDYLIPEELLQVKEIREYDIRQNLILGKRIVTAKKRQHLSLDELSDAMKQIPGEIPLFSTIGNYCLRKGVNCSILGRAEPGLPNLAVQMFFKKEDVFSYFKNNQEYIKELVKRIDISLQLNDFS